MKTPDQWIGSRILMVGKGWEDSSSWKTEAGRKTANGDEDES